MNSLGNILYVLYCIICEHLHDLFTLGSKGLKKIIPRDSLNSPLIYILFSMAAPHFKSFESSICKRYYCSLLHSNILSLINGSKKTERKSYKTSPYTCTPKPPHTLVLRKRTEYLMLVLYK